MISLTKSEIYLLSTRIKQEFMYRIQNGTKNVEFRATTAFWDTRCTNAMKYLKDGKEVHLTLICGRSVFKIRVMAVGKMTTGPHFWDQYSLGDQPWTPGEVWAILMGEFLI